MTVNIRTYEKYNMYCVQATIDGETFLDMYFPSEQERDECYRQLRRYTQEIANSKPPKPNYGRCFHERRRWVNGRVVKTCYHTADQMRERTEYCVDCGVETDSETFWD